MSRAWLEILQEETGCGVVIGALMGVHSGLFTSGSGSECHVVRLLFTGDLRGEPRGVQADEVDVVGWHPFGSLPPNTTAWAALGAELLR
ncbi:NUDIX domain-containing protein [Pseudactinotalea sp.]|uniref:NUDIX domain-containing protein n=1 Tax=Pseudactinotalea sp. TaxID=1926260 RepID=UPI003B3BB726